MAVHVLVERMDTELTHECLMRIPLAGGAQREIRIYGELDSGRRHRLPTQSQVEPEPIEGQRVRVSPQKRPCEVASGPTSPITGKASI